MSEEYWQERVSNYLKIRNKRLLLNLIYKEDNIAKLIYLNDAPLQHPNFYCYFYVSKFKKDNIKVLISGDGAMSSFRDING